MFRRANDCSSLLIKVGLVLGGPLADDNLLVAQGGRFLKGDFRAQELSRAAENAISNLSCIVYHTLETGRPKALVEG